MVSRAVGIEHDQFHAHIDGIIVNATRSPLLRTVEAIRCRVSARELFFGQEPIPELDHGVWARHNIQDCMLNILRLR